MQRITLSLGQCEQKHQAYASSYETKCKDHLRTQAEQALGSGETQSWVTEADGMFVIEHLVQDSVKGAKLNRLSCFLSTPLLSYLVLRWGHALVWVLLALSFLLRGTRWGGTGVADIVAGLALGV